MHCVNPYNSNHCRSLLFMLFIIINSAIIPSVHAGDFYKGRITYTTYCQTCHGSNGRGELAGTPNFTRGQSIMKPDSSLFKSIINGKNAMPAFQGVLKNEEIYNVISYIRNFH